MPTLRKRNDNVPPEVPRIGQRSNIPPSTPGVGANRYDGPRGGGNGRGQRQDSEPESAPEEQTPEPSDPALEGDTFSGHRRALAADRFMDQKLPWEMDAEEQERKRAELAAKRAEFRQRGGTGPLSQLAAQRGGKSPSSPTPTGPLGTGPLGNGRRVDGGYDPDADVNNPLAAHQQLRERQTERLRQTQQAGTPSAPAPQTPPPATTVHVPDLFGPASASSPLFPVEAPPAAAQPGAATTPAERQIPAAPAAPASQSPSLSSAPITPAGPAASGARGQGPSAPAGTASPTPPLPSPGAAPAPAPAASAPSAPLAAARESAGEPLRQQAASAPQPAAPSGAKPSVGPSWVSDPLTEAAPAAPSVAPPTPTRPFSQAPAKPDRCVYQIVDAASGNPLPGARLELEPSQNERLSLINGQADMSGTFRIKAIAPGSYQLTVRHPGYIPLVETREITADQADEATLALRKP